MQNFGVQDTYRMVEDKLLRCPRGENAFPIRPNLLRDLEVLKDMDARRRQPLAAVRRRNFDYIQRQAERDPFAMEMDAEGHQGLVIRRRPSISCKVETTGMFLQQLGYTLPTLLERCVDVT